MNTAVEFPTGIGGKGNEGVAGFTSRTKGAIGYVEHAYAIRSKLAYVSLKNRDGEFVTPGRQAFQSAVANADWAAAPAFYAPLLTNPASRLGRSPAQPLRLSTSNSKGGSRQSRC